MKLLIKRSGIFALFLLAMGFLGCEDDDEGNALPEVVAQFIFELNQATGTVEFTNLSENADEFEWDFGNGTSSTEISPTVTFVTGTYTVSLTATNVAGAEDTFEDELVIVVPEPIVLPITFDDAIVDYAGGTGTFGGAAFQIVANPAPGGSNDQASQVGEITNSGTAFEGFFFDLGTPLDLATDKTVNINFWSEVPIDVLFKLEQGTGADTEVTASHGGTGWEMLSFNFTSSDSFSRLTFFVDGPGTTAGTFFIDDIEQIEAVGGGDAPTVAAPTPPNRDAADVISLFSNAYTNINVDTFYAAFSQGGGQTNEQVAGDDVLLYTDLDFAGIETITETVDLSSMTNFHIDVWTATDFDLISGVVDFGGDGFGGANPDTRGDTRNTLTAGQWTQVDVSIADLQAAGLTATPTDFSQLILDVVDVVGTIYVDNIYFYNEGAGGGGDVPTMAAPTPPMRDAADVVSLFSNAYTNINVDTFYAAFSQGGGQTNEQVAGDDVLLYTDLDFAGIETITEVVDLSSMTNFHIDVWTATGFDFISGVVDFGGDGFGGANPDTRGDTRNTLTAGQWTQVDVSIADLQAAGLTATPTDFSQLILDVVDVIGTVYVDNIYFYNEGTGAGGDAPTMAAPTPPMRDAADVVSLFSNAYTDINADTFYAAFSQGGGQTNEMVAGDDVLLYTDLDFAGIETITETVDLTSMTNFHIDVWTATGFDFISGVVDFGGDGFGGANPDTRGDTRNTLTAGQWTQVDVSIADLQAAGLTATPTDFSQLILDVVDVIGTVYVDNIYFYNDGSGGGGDAPTMAAPTPPSRDAADVISIFSNAYTDINADTFYAAFSQGGGQTNEMVAGDDVLLYTDLDFAGIETITETVDLSAMTNFHIDVWTATGFDFISGVVDFGGDGFGGANPDTRGDTRNTLTAGQWTQVDVSIADLQAAGLTATPTDFSQLILDVVDVIGSVYVDNIYFYNDGSGGGGSAPTMAAPTPPTRDAADVVSIFSNAYSNVTVDTFYAAFSQGGGQTNEMVAGDDVLLYTDLDFAGIETITATVDLTGMTNFHIDVWTATGFDFISGVVDFGGDGFAGANPDTRGDTRNTLTAGQWTQVDVSIADLQAAGLTATPTDFSQLILDVVDVIGTVYVDNIYFYR